MRGSDPVSRLGLIAGCGSLPGEAARALRRAGTTVVALGFEGLTDPGLEREVDALRWQKLGRLEAAAASLRDLAVQSILLAGSIPKRILFDGSGRLEPDRDATALLAGLGGWKDDALFSALAGWLEGQGFTILGQDRLLRALLAEEGAFSQREPTASERGDLAVGRRALDALGAAGIGQCVVVRQGCVVAVEAAEGTDATIRRAGDVAGAGATVVKGVRPEQDRRFDLPAIGPGTLAAMSDAGATCLAVEAGGTLVLERETTRSLADRAGIACLGFARDRVGA
jgi:DUF1009 family protein